LLGPPDAHRSLDELFEDSNDAVFITDPLEDRILDANAAASSLLGYTRDEFMVTPISQIHPHELPRMRAFLEVALRDLEFFCRELHSFADDLARAGHERAAVADERARTKGAGSDQQRRSVGIARAQPDRLGGDAQKVGDDDGKHRLVPLAGRTRQGEQIERDDTEHQQSQLAALAQVEERQQRNGQHPGKEG